MLKIYEKSFALVQKLIDVGIVSFCWCLAVFFRFSYFKGQGLDLFYVKLALPLAFITTYFFARGSLYKSQRLSTIWKEVGQIIQANFLSVITFVVLIYFVNESKLSRATVIGYFFFSTTVLFLSRFGLRVGLRILRRQGRNLRHAILVGHGEIIESYVAKIKGLPDAGINFAAWIDSRGSAKTFSIKEFEGNLEQARKTYSPDCFIIGYPGTDNLALEEFLKKNYDDVVPLVVLPDFRYSFIGFQVEDLAGFPALVVNQPNFSVVDEFSKRVFDIVASSFGLLIISPLLGLLSVLIKLDSKGPVFFQQERVGLDGRRFKMWKFRTMCANAEHLSQWTVQNDPRRTVLGKFLRISSLDELPQLWNVFVGEMSLVGPRPEQPHFVEKFRGEIPAYMLRHKVKAGITGWAQVNGWRGDTSLQKRIECDLFYVRNWSLWLDVKIICLTFWRGFLSKNAY